MPLSQGVLAPPRTVAAPVPDRSTDRPIELSVIAPTFNEGPECRPVRRSRGRSLTDVGWEIVFVDDNSPDGTSALAAPIARVGSPRPGASRRIGRRGLASACIEGILASPAPTSR